MGAIHPSPTEFSEEQIKADAVLRYFHWAHLPPVLQGVSRPFCDLAWMIVTTLPRNAERSVALRKLLEAKDAAVRANVPVVAIDKARPETFYERLLVEQKDLADRVSKLDTFLGSDGFERLSIEQQNLLHGQFRAMQDYASILGKRLAILGTDVLAPVEEIDENVRLVGGDKSEEPIPFR